MYIRTAESGDVRQLVYLIERVEHSNFMLFELGKGSSNSPVRINGYGT